MIYSSGEDWRKAPQKRVLLFGMSGLGKTHLSRMLRRSGDWFHYSVDYRIGTRYMGEAIEDNLKREAMKNPFLRDLLLSNSVTIAANMTFENLAPLSSYLGKPGDPGRAGLPFDEYRRRQGEHRDAEIAATRDSHTFIERARALYGYGHFICDSSGSFCEVVDPHDPDDALLAALARDLLLVWIEGTEAHAQELIRRSIAHPKPMYYEPGFMADHWQNYLRENKLEEGEVDPDAFARAIFADALAHRRPRYRAIARTWGISVSAEDVARVDSPAAFDDLIAAALDARGANAHEA